MSATPTAKKTAINADNVWKPVRWHASPPAPRRARCVRALAGRDTAALYERGSRNVAREMLWTPRHGSSPRVRELRRLSEIALTRAACSAKQA
jgi:hypothetical protein